MKRAYRLRDLLLHLELLLEAQLGRYPPANHAPVAALDRHHGFLFVQELLLHEAAHEVDDLGRLLDPLNEELARQVLLLLEIAVAKALARELAHLAHGAERHEARTQTLGDLG